MKILLFGKNGQLGWELQRSLSVLGQVTALDRRITADDVALIGEHDLVIDGTDSFSANLYPCAADPL